MADDQLSSAREMVLALAHAARSFIKYPAGHPRRAEVFEVCAVRATGFGERWGDLKITVEKKQLTVNGSRIFEDTPEFPPITHALASAGVRSMTLGSGITREEVQTLAEIFARSGRGDEDTVSALWRAQLWAVTIEAEDDVDLQDAQTAAETVATHERIEDARTKARTPGGEGLHAAPPIGRDYAVEAPPPPPATLDESRTQLSPEDIGGRALEILRTALWRADAPVNPDASARLVIELVRKALAAGDLQAAADMLDLADPAEAPAAAVKCAEKSVSALGPDLVRCVPPLYAQRAPQGEEAALALALRALQHLDTQGVKTAAVMYSEVPTAARRPLRRLLSARGAEALDNIVRLADHRAIDIAKDGLAILALIPLDGARAALKRFVDDPTTPRERLELARGALQHAEQVAARASAKPAAKKPAGAPAKAGAPAAGKTQAAQTLIPSLRDSAKDKRLAAARTIASLGTDTQCFAAVEALVTLPGFPSADEDEQKAFIDALAGSGPPDKAIKVLERIVTQTLGLPTSRIARQTVDGLKRARRV